MVRAQGASTRASCGCLSGCGNVGDSCWAVGQTSQRSRWVAHEAPLSVGLLLSSSPVGNIVMKLFRMKQQVVASHTWTAGCEWSPRTQLAVNLTCAFTFQHRLKWLGPKFWISIRNIMVQIVIQQTKNCRPRPGHLLRILAAVIHVLHSCHRHEHRLKASDMIKEAFILLHVYEQPCGVSTTSVT